MSKSILTILLIFISSFFSFCNVDPAENSENEINFKSEVNLDIIKMDNNVGLKLFQMVSEQEKDENIFMSPTSILTAIGMVLNGAEGSTLSEMLAALQIEKYTLDQINQTHSAIVNKIPLLDKETTVSIANSIWYKKEFRLKSKFLNTVKKHFDAEIRDLDFYNPKSVEVINGWVKSRTRDKINRIIEQIAADDVMYLLNAIYFKGIWESKFNKEATYEGDFHIDRVNSVKCHMMRKSSDFLYFENDAVQVIELPYGNKQFSMNIYLPKADQDLDKTLSKLSFADLNSWVSQLSSNEGVLELPRFKLESSITLNSYLKSIGIKRAFSAAQAEFPNMIDDNNFFISDVKHKSFIEVDEEGTEAAAVTSISIKATALNLNKFKMIVDHPFFFTIKEKSTGLILFIGKVNNPVSTI